jgi:hypothetical protein
MDREADLIRMLADDLDGVRIALASRSAAQAVGRGALDEGEGCARALQQRHRPVATLAQGRMRLMYERAAVSIHRGMALAAVQLLGIPVTVVCANGWFRRSPPRMEPTKDKVIQSDKSLQ